MSTIVIMPGGFHPFHAGHAALYNSARRAFPDAEVYVAATNDTSTRPFPFAVKEKLAKLAGVEPGHFVQVKSPFQTKEITQNYDPERDQVIFVRSEKDANKPPQAGGVKKDGSPTYLQPLLGAKKLEPFGRHAYMAYLPTVEFGPGMTSATEIRAEWPTLDEQGKLDRVMSLYPATQKNPPLAANVVKMLDTAMGGEELNEFAPDEGSGSRKFIPWTEFIEQLKQILHKDFSCKENIVKSTIKARFVPHDPMEFGPTMLYSYYEARAGRNKGAISTRGSIQVGKYTKGGLFGQNPDQLLTGFHLLKGHPFERHFDLTFDNIYKIANIIQGNTEGALEFQPQQQVNEFAPSDDSDNGKEDLFFKYAKLWYNGNEQVQQRIIDILDQAGWEIGGIESEEGGVFVVQSGDEDGDTYMGWSAQELQSLSEETRAAGGQQGAGMTATWQRKYNQPPMEGQGFAATLEEDPDYIEEKWSEKYKKSINCSNPRGFSQRAHCAGRKK